MKKMIALACLGFAFTVSTPAVAAGEKMKGCSKEATGMKGDERKIFMKKCLSKDYVLGSGITADAAAPDVATPPTPSTPDIPATSAASSAQQEKMKACNAEAKNKELKGADRKTFMSACLKG